MHANDDPVNKNILMVGFHADAIEAMAAAGVPVTACLLLDERGEKRTVAVRNIYPFYPAIFCQIQLPLQVDFDAGLRRELYSRSAQIFRRHYLRMGFARSRPMRSWTELDNLFHIAANFYFAILKQNSISHIVFKDFPHEGSCIILYELARLLGVDTVIVSPSAFPSRLWIVRNTNDYGKFETIQGGGQALTMPAEPTVPFYMKGISWYDQFISGSQTILREAGKISLKYMTLQPLYNRAAIDRNKTRLMNALDRFMTGHPDRKSEVVVDVEKPFIYFPLHFQPEMSTDTFGFEYGDQLLALEELSASLAPGIDIYVKENPKQGRYMRERSFFQRLSAIPNVHYMKPTISSFELIRRSLCVATISGTAGWEALLVGKSVIHFGVAWYACLPGALRWRGPQTLDDALSFVSDREALSFAFDEASRKSYPGVVNLAYGSIVPGFDRATEVKKAVGSIILVLNETARESD